MSIGTYVYCLISSDRKPPAPRRAARMPGMGPVRFLETGKGRWLAVASAPLNRYGEEVINHKLSDLAWVSHAAVAHEAVVESFTGQKAVLPMKLFTIFASDDRAVEEMQRDRQRVDALIKKVANHQEWGVRVTLDKARVRPPKAARQVAAKAAGTNYLSRKKAQRDAAVELAEHAQETVASLYDRLGARASLARRRFASELPVQGGPMLIDAAFLVPRTRAVSFRTLVKTEARRLERLGYHVTLTGPWPPYTFVNE
jgi:hypothetical protein